MTFVRAVAACSIGVLTVAVLTVGARAGGDPRDVDVPRAGALPEGTPGFQTRREAAVYGQPSRGALPVGRTVDGAGFTVRGSARGPGCTRLFVSVGPGQWVCGDDGLLRPEPMVPTAYALPRTADGLPWDYAFTTGPRTRVYSTAATALAGDGGGVDTGVDTWVDTWEAHWGFAVRSARAQGAERALETLDGQWLRRRDVFRAEPAGFVGGAFTVLSAGGTVPFGWVVAPGGARTWRLVESAVRAASTTAGDGRLPRLSSVRVYASRVLHGTNWARIDGGLWVSMASLRVFTPEGPPPGVDITARERWIDVDLTQQVLTAYEGATPVYATLVSTGDAGTETRTGVWRIWGKYAARTMDNTENAALAGHWRMGDVPYVQFFDQDRGLHGVYWHEDFGHPRSHGCVNLSPRDAAYLFGYTSPGLPGGWQWVTPSGGGGTVVRVRGVTPPRA